MSGKSLSDLAIYRQLTRLRCSLTRGSFTELMLCGRLRRGVDGLSVHNGHLAFQIPQVAGRDAVGVAVPYGDVGALACFEGSDLLLEEELRCGRGGVGA